ncbi:MAG: methionine adenosyltransferase [Clostridiaceae bacterium]|nr:methionine adenosyltransferase [Clostridiaceae bacterium]
MQNKLFTSESVTEGHPDKLCDQVSDAILDAVIQQDKNSRVACETVATTGMVMVMGEMSTNCYVDIPSLVRKVVKDIGYTDAAYGFDYKTCSVMTTIDEQSPDIAMGVDNAFEHRSSGKDPLDLIGAGDQGMVFGYACNETPQLMPAPIMFAHQLTKMLSQVRKSSLLPFILPDGKSQVTVEYGDDGMPKRIDTVVISTQHSDDVQLATLREAVMEEVIKKALPKSLLDKQTKYYINPTGRFVIGGPQGDSGLTGRKIIVDTYGGYSRHGGGAFSGKDPTKVDRSAAYMARYAAKNIVAAGLAQRCEIELAYAIGVANPVSVFVETFDTGIIPQNRLVQAVTETFDLRPAAIIKNLGLLRPIYRQTASYGHFGRDDIDLPWENLDKVNEMKKYL